jgi:UDP-N-acetylmuramate dehydrogenase
MIRYNYQLKQFNTFGISATARRFITLESVKEAEELLRSGELKDEKVLILGGGSNILFTKDFDGTVIHPLFDSIEMVAKGENLVFVAAEAGAIWDDMVAWCVERDLGGVENLSYIPGNVGAAPIQNIGAYGAEVSHTISKVRTLSLESGETVDFTREECGFGYRNSIFKNEMKDKFLITVVFFELERMPDTFNLEYGNLRDIVEEAGEINLYNVRRAVTSIRRDKLPEPTDAGNAGSFFKNPVVSAEVMERISVQYNDIPSWPASNNGFKIPAAWLIEKCGFKGYRQGDAGVHDKQSLVLVNHGNATGKEILSLALLISRSVKEKFGIDLETEVNIL